MDLGFNLDDWNNTEAIEYKGFETLELGGHKIVIKNAELYKSQVSGNTSLKIEVDTTAKDKQPSYFQKQFDENTNADKKWSTGATRYLSLKKESLGYTKGFITALEKSNNNFKFDTSKDWKQLKGLECVGVFGLEEYLDNEGQKRTATKLTQFRSADQLEKVRIPRVKLLDGSFIDYEEYISQKATDNNSNDPFGDLNDVVEISENFLD